MSKRRVAKMPRRPSSSRAVTSATSAAVASATCTLVPSSCQAPSEPRVARVARVVGCCQRYREPSSKIATVPIAPTELPGDNVPPFTVVEDKVPVPPAVAPALTVVPLDTAIDPFTRRVPALTVVLPV